MIESIKQKRMELFPKSNSDPDFQGGKLSTQFAKQQQQAILMQQQAAEYAQQQQAQQAAAYAQQQQVSEAMAKYQKDLAEYEIKKKLYQEQVAAIQTAQMKATMPIDNTENITVSPPQINPNPIPNPNPTQTKLYETYKAMKQENVKKTWFQKNGVYLFIALLFILAITCSILCYFQTRTFKSNPPESDNINNLTLIYVYAAGAVVFGVFAIIVLLKKVMIHSK